MKYLIKSMLLMTLTIAAFCSYSQEETTAKEYENYSWQSPNNWQGGIFDVPTWFAKDMLYTGTEIIRFHDGFYDEESNGFWTYAFVLLVDQTKTPSTAELIDETNRYFVGLVRTLGDNKIVDYPAEKISVKSVSDWSVNKNKNSKSQLFSLESFDSFNSGKPLLLNVKITTWLCSDKKRAIHYAISPHDFSNPIWRKLDKEISAVKCW